jgi:polyferredoxin
MLTSLSGWMDMTVIVSVGMLLLLLIVVGSLYIERFFCRYLCPAWRGVRHRVKFGSLDQKAAHNCGPCALHQALLDGDSALSQQCGDQRGMHRLHELR